MFQLDCSFTQNWMFDLPAISETLLRALACTQQGGVLKRNKYVGILSIAVTTLQYITISMITIFSMYIAHVTDPPVTLARKVGPGLQDLQTRARRILAERNAEKAEENTWIGRMVAAENINDMKALIKSRDSV